MFTIWNTFLIYNLVFLLCFFLLRKAHGKFPVLLSYLILVIVASVRYDVGADYDGYYRDVEIVKDVYSGNMSVSALLPLLSVGPILSGLIYLLRETSHTLLYIVAIYSISEMVVLYMVLEKYKAHFEGILIYVLSCLMFIVWDAQRQGLAFFIVLYSIPFIEDRKMGKYFLTIFVAGLAHYSAWILFPFYWLCKFRLSNRGIISIIFVLFVLAQFKLFTSASSFFSELIPYYSETYSDNDKYTVSGETIHDPSFLFTVFWYVFLLICSPKNNKVFNTLLFTGCCVYIMSGGNLNMDRISLYFTSSIILYFKGLKEMMRKKIVKLQIVRFLLLLMYLLFNIHILSGTYKGCSPYETIFSVECRQEIFRSNE